MMALEHSVQTNSHQWLQHNAILLIIKVPRHIPQYYGPSESITRLTPNEPERREIPQEISLWKPIGLSMQHFEAQKYAKMAIA